MTGDVSGVNFGAYTINSNKPLSDFEKTGDVIDDEIISFVAENNSELVSKLGLDAQNLSVDDLANALNSSENTELQDEIANLKSALSDNLYELITGENQLYSDDALASSDLDDARETAVDYFSKFNTSGDKATELQNFVLEAIAEYDLSEEEAQEVLDSVNQEMAADGENVSLSGYSTTDELISIADKEIETASEALSEIVSGNIDDGDDYDYSTMTSASNGGKVSDAVIEAVSESARVMKTAGESLSDSQNDMPDSTERIANIMQNYLNDNNDFNEAYNAVKDYIGNNNGKNWNVDIENGVITTKDGKKIATIEQSGTTYKVGFENQAGALEKGVTIQKATNGTEHYNITQKSWYSPDGSSMNAHSFRGMSGKTSWYLDVNGNGKVEGGLTPWKNKDFANGKDVCLDN